MSQAEQRVVIIGGTSGIGFAAAKLFNSGGIRGHTLELRPRLTAETSC